MKTSPRLNTVSLERGGMCMIEGIYENKSGRGSRYIVRFKSVWRRFNDKQAAERFLTGLRYKHDEGSFDPRDYQKDQPLGFTNLSNNWLEHQKGKRSYGHIRRHIQYTQDFFDNKNVRTIGFGELEDLFHQLPGNLGEKTRANIAGTLKAFWKWVSRREKIEIPAFPEFKPVLKFRKTVDFETQQAIIEEVRRISNHVDPKIHIAIKWLARYYSIRPVELLHIQEGDFDFQLAGVWVKYNKVADQYKFVPMLPEDLETVRSFPEPISNDLYFFRYNGRRFGRKRLYKWWKKACANLGVEGVDLYGGCIHSTTQALRATGKTPEEIKRGSMRQTSKAFNRYFQMELDDIRSLYGATDVQRQKVLEEKGKILKLKGKYGRDAGI